MDRESSAADGKRPGSRGLVEELRKDIEGGLYAVGSALPAYRELKETFGVPLSTVNAAIHQLEQMGYVTVSPGKRVQVRDRTAAVPAKEQLLQLRAELRDVREVVREAGAAAAALERRLTALLDGIRVDTD
jgi:DNA-binding FadR family transcriptional regulator